MVIKDLNVNFIQTQNLNVENSENNVDVGTERSRISKTSSYNIDLNGDSFHLTPEHIFNSFLIYKEKSITRFLYLINIFISLIALSRFFIPYFRDGQNPGNVQSLIFGTFLILFTILINMLINQKIQNKKACHPE